MGRYCLPSQVGLPGHASIVAVQATSTEGRPCSGDQVQPFMPVALETVRVPPAKDPACLDLRLASYNVLSLNGAAFADGHSEGLAFAAGRPALLAKNLAQQEVGVAFIQEARTQEGFVRTQDYLRFCSGCEKGHLGVEIWLRDALPIMRRGHDTVVRLSRDACSVLLSDPRRLALHFQQGNFRLRMLSLHAPHTPKMQSVHGGTRQRDSVLSLLREPLCC